MTIQQLSGTDVSFLYWETPETPMHVGSLYLYELPAGYAGDFYADFKAFIAERLHLLPVFTRKLAQLPFDIDAPLWVEDEDIDLDYHIRRLTVPKPGRLEDLEELVGQLHSSLLDRSRPLWQIYIIDGLADGRIAEFTKFHHAGFDGAAAMAIVRGLYDTTPVPRPAPRRPPPKREDADLLSLLGLLYTNPLRQYLRAVQAVPDLLKAWNKLLLPDPQTLKLEPPALPPLAPATPLNVAITSQRACAVRTVSLKDIKGIGKANDVTVNDVVLALCSAALRRYLRERRELPEQSLTAFVPMSLREAGNVEMTNRTIGMICSLATDVADPLKRLASIHESANNAKRLTDVIRSVALDSPSPMGAPLLIYGLMNLLGRYRLADNLRPIANLTISNLVGSPVPLYLLGARLIANYPLSITTHGSALNITVWSYGDNLDVGLVACRRAAPDLRALGDYIAEALEELKSATQRAAVRAAARSAPRPKKRGAARPARKPKRGTRKKAARSASVAQAPKYPYLVRGGGGERAGAAKGGEGGATQSPAGREDTTSTPAAPATPPRPNQQ